MTTSTATFTADASLAAMDLLDRVTYSWERSVIELLDGAERLVCTRSGFIKVDGKFLKGWQIKRLIEWGVIESKSSDYTHAADRGSASSFDAPLDYFYPVTPIGRALALLIA